MIFITVGTEKFQFDRLMKIVDEAVSTRKIRQEIFAQTGKCNYKPKSFAYKEFIDFNEMALNIKKAEIVVSHAGVGSVILSLSLGKIPIIFPRRYDLGEHLDNHQMEFAKKIEAIQKAVVAYNGDEMIYKINNYYKILADLKPKSENTKDKLVAYLRELCGSIEKV